MWAGLRGTESAEITVKIGLLSNGLKLPLLGLEVKVKLAGVELPEFVC